MRRFSGSQIDRYNIVEIQLYDKCNDAVINNDEKHYVVEMPEITTMIVDAKHTLLNIDCLYIRSVFYRSFYHSCNTENNRCPDSRQVDSLLWKIWIWVSSECRVGGSPTRSGIPVQGCLADTQQPPPLGPPCGPRHSPTVVS
jgi:hypothetical protein